MLEQVLDISKAFNLEDLGFLLDDLPETNGQSDQTNTLNTFGLKILNI